MPRERIFNDMVLAEPVKPANVTSTPTLTFDKNPVVSPGGVGKSFSTSSTSTSTSTTSTAVKPTVIGTKNEDDGSVTGFMSDGTHVTLVAAPAVSKANQNAFEEVKNGLAAYGIEGLASTLSDLMMANVGPEQAKWKLQSDTSINPKTGKAWNAAFAERFSGNTARLAKGLNVLEIPAYLALENSYQETLAAYGLTDTLGTTTAQRQKAMGEYIAAGINAPTFQHRVSSVVDGVVNGDPLIKSQLKSYYNIDENNLIKYFLDPQKNGAELDKQIGSATIGAAAQAQHLGLNSADAELLQSQGVTQSQAQQGFATVAGILPDATKASNIYGEANINYTQKDAQAEVFNQSDAASAQRKRKQLADLQAGSFGGRTSGSFAQKVTGTL